MFFSTTGKTLLTHQEVVSYVVSEPPTNKNRSVTASIINDADNENLAEKLTIKQEYVYIASSTKHVE